MAHRAHDATTKNEFIPPSVGGIEWLRPLLFKGNVSLLFLKTVEPSLQQVPLGHDFVHRMCHTKDSVVCLELQCGSGIAYATHLSSPEAIKTRRPCHGSCQKAPEASSRGRGCIRDGLRPLPPTPEKELLYTAMINAAGSDTCGALR